MDGGFVHTVTFPDVLTQIIKSTLTFSATQPLGYPQTVRVTVFKIGSVVIRLRFSFFLISTLFVIVAIVSLKDVKQYREIEIERERERERAD
jgi:hypothetical protein